jgi:hypothetical protein
MFSTVDGFFHASNEEWTLKIYVARAYPFKKGLQKSCVQKEKNKKKPKTNK